MPRFILKELSTLEAGLGQLLERIQHYQHALSTLQQTFTQANAALEHAQNERNRLHLECEALRSERHLLANRIENAKHALQTTLDDLSHTGWVEPALHLLRVPDENQEPTHNTLVFSDSEDTQEEEQVEELIEESTPPLSESDVSEISDVSDAHANPKEIS